MNGVARRLERAVAAARLGRRSDAARLCDEVLAHDPDQPDALYLRGRLAAEDRDLERAAVLLGAAALRRSGDPAVQFHLGMVLVGLGRDQEAVGAFERAAALDPREAAIHVNRGTLLMRLARHAEAAAAFAAAARLLPDDAEVHRNLANCLIEAARPDEAYAAAMRAVALRPDDLATLLVRGVAEAVSRRYADAERSFAAVLAREPDHVGCLVAMATLAAKAERFAEGAALAERAVALAPDDPEALYGLSAVLSRQGRAAEAVGALERALALPALRPQRVAFFLSALIASELYLDRRDGPALAAEIARHAARIDAAAPPAAPAVIDRTPGRKLRIGYLAPDFRVHSVTTFFQPIFEDHDRTQFEFVCYAEVREPDHLTRWFSETAHAWRETVARTDAEVAASIRADRIDVLVDLGGHTSDSRIAVLAHRPAPVQATWLGFAGTTGMRSIDWRISDAVCDPPQEDALSTERVWRMAPGFHAWGVPAGAGAPAPLPGLAGGFTFGSYSAIVKLSDATLALWGRVLAAVPGARLLLKNAAGLDPPTARRLLDRCAAAGAPVDRIDLATPQRDVNEHFASYGRIDVALDPTPYNGTTTICEGLWMGVPTITLTGDRHAGRVGTSLMTQVGLPQFVARSADEYVAIAVRCAQARQRLAAIRASLRERMARSPLCDVPGFARRLEDAYRGMWRDRLERP